MKIPLCNAYVCMTLSCLKLLFELLNVISLITFLSLHSKFFLHLNDNRNYVNVRVYAFSYFYRNGECSV